jgi:hypothetical protein
MQKRLLFLVALMLTFSLTLMAQITTSSLAGKVTLNSEKGEEVIGATIQAVHVPSGTRYGAVTNAAGRYTIQGMRAGGPYEVSVSYIGYETKTFQKINLLLGETYNLNVWMEEDAKQLSEIVVTGRAGLDATKTGAAQSISLEEIERIPSVTHSISDVIRTNPQVTTTQSGAFSFAGTNNRYNSFQIDGAMNNDVFGLTSSGSNGGQADANPVSMETIDQIQVNVAPFDVRQSGFTGGAVNAITKSGTNVFHGSVYGYGYNQDLIGRKYKKVDGSYSNKYEKEQEYQIGFTIGGPIIKDKLFFFANYEKANKEYPNVYGIGMADSKIDATQAQDILTKVKKLAADQGYTYGGTFSNPDVFTKSDKAGIKLDWNINEKNKFSFRWSLVHAQKLNNVSTSGSLRDNYYAYPFTSNTNSFVAELHSQIKDNMSNEARASWVRVRDKRDITGPFSQVQVNNVGGGSVIIGNNYSSMANKLDQDIFTFEDNFSWYLGNHTLTFGTHDEIYKFGNLFIENLYGAYTFNSVDEFNTYYNIATGATPSDGKAHIYQYYYAHANTDVTGDPRWMAQFTAGQLGFYAQDKWDVNNNFQLTYGLRMEIPLFFDTPMENAPFNEFAAKQGWGVKTNHKLSSSPLLSPRVGFRWDIAGDRKYILRGGAGIFTGRIPYVWISNNFSNTGIQLSSYSARNNKDIYMYLDPNNQSGNEAKLKASGSQIVNVFDDDFKFAQNIRLNLGFDFRALGIDWTAEAIYSKTLNDIYYKQLAYDLNGETVASTYGYDWDKRPMYKKVTTGTAFNEVYGLYNTSKGYTYNLSLKAEKKFDFGLDLMASYTFTKSKSVNNGSSSVAKSNFRYNYTHGDSNNPELGNSAYNVPHRIQASVFYHADYGVQKNWRTTVGLIYTGKSGSPYSYYYYGDLNGDYADGNDLMFIPTDAQIDKMQFKDLKVSGKTLDAAQQRADLKEWIAGDSYLSKHRGEYYDRYADNLPFEHHFDFHFGQKFSFKVGKQINAIEFTCDILNVANLLNKDWGHTYGDGFGVYYSPVTYSGNGQFQFNKNNATKSYSDFYSRWRGQIGLKYTF